MHIIIEPIIPQPKNDQLAAINWSLLLAINNATKDNVIITKENIVTIVENVILFIIYSFKLIINWYSHKVATLELISNS